MVEARLNWSTAQVRNGKLAVELEGEIDKVWKKSFKRTVKLLGDGDWREVELKKGAVRVAGVTPGGEEKLRHYLEGVVEQANASQAPPQETGEEAKTDLAEKGPDAEMTRHFRAFAEDQDEAGSD